MCDFVGANVASLGKFLVAYLARVWFLARMSSFMSLHDTVVSILRIGSGGGFLILSRLTLRFPS